MWRTICSMLVILALVGAAACASMEYKKNPTYAPEPAPWEQTRPR